MIDAGTVVVLFSSIAAIVATMTGLIGAFATFRLQSIDAKLDFLKDYVMHKAVTNEKTLNEKVRETGYRQIESIYVHDFGAVDLVTKLVADLGYHSHSGEYEHDLKNIAKNQHKYDRIKKLTRTDFSLSMGLVFASLLALAFANPITASRFIWPILAVFFVATGLIFREFSKQVRILLG